ncbi:MAG TPA: hypothetical protein VHQ90_14410 [Thermoanaerobaculia bacterium]|nr:hypothetical protein [Thermoanaerobaculia bacterium]
MPPDEQFDLLLKSLADATAETLAGAAGPAAVALLNRLGLLAESAPAEAAQPSFAPGWVGIWEPRPQDGQAAFERAAERAAEWSLWADVARIPPKSARKRVIFLGESVARGYFYDPRFTPAQVLAAMLGTAGVPGGVEVVDLAKNDIGAPDLAELLTSALALEPDLCVIFAGNNWAQAPVSFPDVRERAVVATVLRSAGVAGLKAFFEAQLASQVSGQLQSGLAPLAAAIPVVLILPEFNLGDWRLGGAADAPWLPGDANKRWLHCLTAAQEALAAGRLEEAAAAAARMVALDQGTAASGLTVLAECRRRLGQLEQARELLERARDAHCWDAPPQVPKPLSVVQQALRQGAEAAAIPLVDLPRLFQDWLGGELPDRRLFLDYCHLNAEGIRLAMSAAAERIAPLLGGREVGRETLAGAAPVPDPEVEAEARFAAAIHNAHWGQPYETVLHHCRQAAGPSAKVRAAMREYLDLQTRQAPAWACSSAERLIGLGVASIRRYVLTYNQAKLLDPALLAAIADALEETGVPCRDLLDRLRRAERGLAADRPVNLVDPYYSSSWSDRDWLWSPALYYRAHSPASSFHLICQSSEPAVFRLTCRQPTVADGSEQCQVSINGTEVARLSLSPSWKTFTFLAGPAALRAGLNRVDIAWPLRTGAAEDALRYAADRLERGLPYPLLPTFGEIHSFTAALAPAD